LIPLLVSAKPLPFPSILHIGWTVHFLILWFPFF
jgi:hypothetical protein